MSQRLAETLDEQIGQTNWSSIPGFVHALNTFASAEDIASDKNSIPHSIPIVAHIRGCPEIYRGAMALILDSNRTKYPDRPVYAIVTHGVHSPDILNAAPRSSGDSDGVYRTDHGVKSLAHVLSMTQPPSPSSSADEREDFFPGTGQGTGYNNVQQWPHVEDLGHVFNNISLAACGIHLGRALVVPPMSAQFSFSLDILPTHEYTPFESYVSGRYKELAPGGMMLIVYPCSLKFYTASVLPCLDLALYHMLALNQVSSGQCELISRAPDSGSAPDFNSQKKCLESLPNSKLVYDQHVSDFEYDNWGDLWLCNEIDWLKLTIRKTLDENHASPIISELVHNMMSNKAWNIPGPIDLAMFVIQKR